MAPPSQQKNAKSGAAAANAKTNWATMNLDEYSNVRFNDAAVGGAASAIVKNASGSFLEFISPIMPTFGISCLETEGKLAYSLSHIFSNNDSEEVNNYRAFLDRLTKHLTGHCNPDCKKPEPLAQFPKKKDANGVFMKKGSEFIRDPTKSPTVRYKIYTEKDKKDKFDTGLLGVRIYNKKGEPMFNYGDKESVDFFRDREPTMERTVENEMAAINSGCQCRVMCSVRIASMYNGSVFHLVLAASKIKHIRNGEVRESQGGKDFGEEEEDDDEENENDEVKRLPAPAVSGGKRKLEQQQQDDGVEDDENAEVKRLPAAVSAGKRKLEQQDDNVEDEVVDEDEIPIVVAPPPQLKKRKLTVPK